MDVGFVVVVPEGWCPKAGAPRLVRILTEHVVEAAMARIPMGHVYGAARGGWQGLARQCRMPGVYSHEL